MYKHDEIIIGTFEGKLFTWYAEYVQKILEKIVTIPVYVREVKAPSIEDYQKIASHTYTNAHALTFDFHITLVKQALSAEDIDIMVLPLEVLPVELPYPFICAAVINRVQHRDVLIARGGRDFHDLEQHANVGVYSARQLVQLKRARRDLDYRMISPDAEGFINVMGMEGLDAVVYPEADIKRLGLDAHITEVFPEETLFPALRQGTLGCIVHRENEFIKTNIARVMDANSHIATRCEEGFLTDFNPPFDAPLGGYATVMGRKLAFSLRSVHPITLETYEGYYETRDFSDPFLFGKKCAYEFEKKGGRTPLSRF